jgi:vitamin B12 transporter
MKTLARFSITVTIVFFPVFSWAEVSLERIVVKPSSFSSLGKQARNVYSVDTIYASTLQGQESAPVTSSLENVSGVDLRTRGQGGIQADPSIRGSTYEQVAVLVDGIKVMDPQTGHYNLDIPLTRFDLERVEVMKEPSSALFGSGAFAGAVAMVTKKPDRNDFQTEFIAGEHALFEEGVSFSRVQDDLSGRVSYEHKSAKAAVQDTDFEYHTGSVYLNKDMEGLDIDFLGGYQKKDYGAGNFYSNLYPSEEEHTETFFSRMGMRYALGPGTLQEGAYFRRHRDKFVLDRHNPVSVNYHTTYVYGLNSGLRLPVKGAEVITGIDISNEEINSSNLGKHQRANQAFSLGIVPEWGERLAVDARLRADYYQDWDWNPSYNLGAGYWLVQNAVKVRGSLAHALRIPSFTELYYRDPANIGNSDLKTEESDSFTAGILFQRSFFSAYVDGFLRKARNVIDWTRFNTASPWQATNLGKVDFTGVECGFTIEKVVSYPLVSIDRLKGSYAHTEAANETSGLISKYALDVLTHQVLLGLEGKMFHLDYAGNFSYNQRHYGESYFLGSITVSKKILRNGLMWEPFIAVENIADTQYSEVGGVTQPGRWVKSGVRLNW